MPKRRYEIHKFGNEKSMIATCTVVEHSRTEQIHNPTEESQSSSMSQ